MKKRQKDFLIFFGIFILAILMYSNWLTMHYASDTYNIMNVGYETYATNWSLKDGRLIMYLITMICAKLNVSIEIYVIGTLLGALLISAGCVIKLKNTILKNGESNLKKEILITIASFFTIFNFMYIENMYFVEAIVMALSLLAFIYSADFIVNNKGIKNKSGINVDEIVVHKGEIVGMAGLVGAGRTESMRILIGADKGKIDELTLFDKQVKQFKNVHSSIENGVVYMTEDRKADGLALSLNVEKNISIASLKKLSRRGLVSEKKAEENANTYVEKLQIKISGLEQQTKLLSGGNQQKVILAKWMSCNPRILIFDEPTKGIDVGAKFEIYKLMNQLSDAGLGIILISSDLSEVIGMSDRVYVYREGHTVGELSHAEIEASNIMQYATGIKKQEGR